MNNFTRFGDRAADINPSKPNGKYRPFTLTNSKAAFYVYAFPLILSINSDYFLKQH
jgi:hypothetical protein